MNTISKQCPTTIAAGTWYKKSLATTDHHLRKSSWSRSIQIFWKRRGHPFPTHAQTIIPSSQNQDQLTEQKERAKQPSTLWWQDTKHHIIHVFGYHTTHSHTFHANQQTWSSITSQCLHVVVMQWLNLWLYLWCTTAYIVFGLGDFFKVRLYYQQQYNVGWR